MRIRAVEGRGTWKAIDGSAEIQSQATRQQANWKAKRTTNGARIEGMGRSRFPFEILGILGFKISIVEKASGSERFVFSLSRNIKANGSKAFSAAAGDRLSGQACRFEQQSDR